MVYENIILGHLSEVRDMNFPQLEQEVEPYLVGIHRIAIRELLSRTLASMWDWEVRTRHMFENNELQNIKDAVVLSLGQVNRLQGCGYTTRKEVYDIFALYHIKLNNWSPEHHRSRMRYKF